MAATGARLRDEERSVVQQALGLMIDLLQQGMGNALPVPLSLQLKRSGADLCISAEWVREARYSTAACRGIVVTTRSSSILDDVYGMVSPFVTNTSLHMTRTPAKWPWQKHRLVIM